jgi:hypothetical protein
MAEKPARYPPTWERSQVGRLDRVPARSAATAVPARPRSRARIGSWRSTRASGRAQPERHLSAGVRERVRSVWEWAGGRGSDEAKPGRTRALFGIGVDWETLFGIGFGRQPSGSVGVVSA